MTRAPSPRRTARLRVAARMPDREVVADRLERLASAIGVKRSEVFERG